MRVHPARSIRVIAWTRRFQQEINGNSVMLYLQVLVIWRSGLSQ
jgi:hypothetical protein